MKKNQWHKPYRARKKRPPLRFLKNRFFLFILLISVFIGGIFYLFCFFPKVQIKEIKVYGSTSSPQVGNQGIFFEDIQKLIREKIVHKILFFNSKSIFLVNINGIKKEVLRNFPQIAKINLKRNFPSTLILEVEERKLIGVWCASQIHDSTGSSQGKCFNLDSGGIIFSENPVPPDTLTIIDSIQKDNITLGQKVIENDILNSIQKLESGFKEINTPIKDFIFQSEERLNVETNEGWEIYFDLKGDLNWQVTKLKQVLEKEIPLQKKGELEYIDLRFGDKVYYK